MNSNETTILEDMGNNIFRCRCFCGEEYTFRGCNLRPHYHNNCGCISKHPLYKVWKDYNRKSAKHKLCDEWKDNPRRFVEDIKPLYKKGKRLLRHDTTQPFSVNNIYFGDYIDQNTNRVDNTLLDNGERICKLSRRLGIKNKGLRDLVYSKFWTLETATNRMVYLKNKRMS